MDQQLEDHRVEVMVGTLLRWGVLSAALVTAVGGVLLLIGHGGDAMDYARFRGEPLGLTGLGEIVRGAFGGESTAIVQLGVVLLIATPILRVFITLLAFLHQRDRLYIVVTALVLAILLFGLLGGGG